ncbi:hypothetical protein ScPMuIL_015728 [Solemya velum]
MEDLGEIIANLSRRIRNVFHLEISRGAIFETFKDFLVGNDAQNNKLKVTFIVDGHREQGIDTGAITHELFTLFFEECVDPEKGMFEGLGHKRLCIANEVAMEKNYFFCLGKAIVMSIVANGPTFPYFTSPCFQYLKTNCVDDIDVTFDDLPENSPVTKILRKLVKEVIHWFGLRSRMDAMDQLQRGLNSLLFLDESRNCPELKNVLVYNHEYCFSKEYLADKLLPKIFALKTTNDDEAHIRDLTANCLLNLKDDQARDLLQYITGMRELPVADLKININFNNQKPTEKYPRAISCAHLLLLPLGNTSDKEFVGSFHTALTHGRIGFGRF